LKEDELFFIELFSLLGILLSHIDRKGYETEMFRNLGDDIGLILVDLIGLEVSFMLLERFLLDCEELCMERLQF
jgi:hypothetical protein